MNNINDDKTKEQIKAAIEFLQGMSLSGDYEETVRINGYISLAVAALQKELSETEVSE